MTTIIKAEGIGKKYLLRHQQQQPYHALRDVLAEGVRQWGRRILHPFASRRGMDASREEFWALQDVSFDVGQGDRVGIIGRNGAGKSTLLKILSRITEPTLGQVAIRGRVASLLEVGTGFHPELTGRENIYLNGAILGMSKRDIQRKFDEIVDFAEVEKFLDTPVKRYSSGMFVRLAFAVAAHLEPDILIVDEVLAVGDAQFQKKCLGKMEDVSTRQGRTVLFVSHNMGAVGALCSSGIFLANGQVAFNGDVKHAMKLYVAAGRNDNKIEKQSFIGSLKNTIEFRKVTINDSSLASVDISPSSDICLSVEGRCFRTLPQFRTSFVLYKDGIRVCSFHDSEKAIPMPQGEFISEVLIPAYYLRPGEYHLSLGGHDGGSLASGTEWIFGNEIASFTILEEWSTRNDFANVGFVNIPHKGRRR